MKPLPLNSKLRGLLLDIEGTTTPISFVHEVLFPYARSRVKDFLASNWNYAEVISDVALLRQEQAAESEVALQNIGPAADEIESTSNYVHWLIDQDRKSTGLKSLQGKIWKQGYLDGTLAAPLFEDVRPALERLHQRGITIAIFSSGSVLAQQLLFAHTEAGDMTTLIDAYFDTTTGSKTAGESYRKIAANLQHRPADILFVSDVAGELDAAKEAAMQTLLCIRPGNPPQPGHGHRHPAIHSFAEMLSRFSL
jgi:enolase-phosphatase E1